MANKFDVNGYDYFEKDPGAVRSYTFDFANHPAGPYLRTGETLDTVVWSVNGDDALLVIGDGISTVSTAIGNVTPIAPVADDTTATVTLSGGTLGVTYTVTCAFSTTGVTTPSVDERSFKIKIAQK